MCELLIASEDAPVPFELVDETLDEMALFVQVLVIIPRLAPITAWRDHGFGLFVSDDVQEPVGIKGFVGDDIVEGEALQECGRL